MDALRPCAPALRRLCRSEMRLKKFVRGCSFTKVACCGASGGVSAIDEMGTVHGAVSVGDISSSLDKLSEFIR